VEKSGLRLTHRNQDTFRYSVNAIYYNCFEIMSVQIKILSIMLKSKLRIYGTHNR